MRQPHRQVPKRRRLAADLNQRTGRPEQRGGHSAQATNGAPDESATPRRSRHWATHPARTILGTDEWTEQRRYMGIELLTKAQLTVVDGDTPTDTTEPVPRSDRRIGSTRIRSVIVSTPRAWTWPAPRLTCPATRWSTSLSPGSLSVPSQHCFRGVRHRCTVGCGR
ncbi:MAG: hypothetical protein E6G35_16355 [Actinobacteria bacterium]|nr:MAG: hypothetical protein E6G35_16355 [Actinomycetota bacterium]